ncbi:MAG: M1 family metallopeptidase [Myxococcota bacterium]
MLVALALTALAGDRLDQPVRPTAQAVSLSLDPSASDFEGRVRIELAVDAKVTSFRLHAEDIDVKAVRVGKKKLADAAFRTEGVFLEITPAKPLKPGVAVVEIEFANDLNENLAGLYKTTEKDRPYLVTQFEADDARLAFPCFDEPAFKIPWTVDLTVPEGLVAVANMPVASQEPADGKVRWTYETSPPMPTYLVALAVGPFEATVVEGTPVPVTVYSPVGTAPQTAAIRDQIPRQLAFLERWFGRPMPYPKLDFAVVPEFSFGGMENVGLVVLTDGLLADPANTSARAESSIAEVVGHEIAHMWFGDLVTLAWWDDLWLNESFASWMGLKARADVLPDHPGRFGNVSRAFGAMRADGRSTMRAVRTEVDPTDVYGSANFLAYPKGQSVLGMTEQWLGADVFRAGIQAYLAEHEHGNATAADLFAALSKASGEDVGALLAPYLDRPGAPLLTFTRTDTGFSVRQERYVTLGSTIEDDAVWPVPLVVRTESGTTRFLLTGREGTFEVGDGWMLPMADGVGYFTWTFEDPAELDRLVAAADQLSPAEQVALVDDLANLTVAGVLDLGRELELYGALASRVGVPAQRGIVGELRTVEDVVDAELEDAFAKYLRETWSARLLEIGLEPTDGDTPQIEALRDGLITWLGKHGDDPAVLALWERASTAFLADPSSVPRSVAGNALVEHAKTQDAAFQDRMLALAVDTDDPGLRGLYLAAFAKVPGEKARSRALAWAMEPERTVDEMFTVVFGIYDDRDRDGDAALQWAMDNHALLAKKLPPHFLPRMMFVGGSGCSMERLERAKAFYTAPERNLPGIDRSAAELTEAVGACVERRATHGPSVRAFLAP